MLFLVIWHSKLNFAEATKELFRFKQEQTQFFYYFFFVIRSFLDTCVRKTQLSRNEMVRKVILNFTWRDNISEWSQYFEYSIPRTHVAVNLTLKLFFFAIFFVFSHVHQPVNVIVLMFSLRYFLSLLFRTALRHPSNYNLPHYARGLGAILFQNLHLMTYYDSTLKTLI